VSVSIGDKEAQREFKVAFSPWSNLLSLRPVSLLMIISLMAGEEFLFVLDGKARITVGSESFDLDQGESATFWSAEEHTYAPAAGALLPVRVLSLRIDDKPA
jgi:hypothetical protein